jgi:hypothetical protein
MKTVRLLCLLIVLTLFLFPLISCVDRGVSTLKREDLFTLGVGTLEEQLDIFQLPGVPYPYGISLVMQNGMIYIGSGSSGKVMEFTSYGDLITLIYNSQKNPDPIILIEDTTEEKITNRKAAAYPFNEIGKIALTPDKKLIVEETLPDERSILDDETGILLNRILLVFNQDGQFENYLGQEGFGGTPFSFISDIHITRAGEIVVVARTIKEWVVYWYTKDGVHLYTVIIDLEKLPLAGTENMLISLERIIPDMSARELYLKLNLYEEYIDTSTGRKAGISRVFSRIYWLDLKTGAYSGYTEIPENLIEEKLDADPTDSVAFYLYELIGVANGGYFFLISTEENDKSRLLILKKDGEVVKRSFLNIEDSELFYKTYYLTSDGILTALLGKEDGATIVWWRSDKYIDTR